MNTLLAYLKLIRWPNLLIIALTQYAVRWGLLEAIIRNPSFIRYSKLQKSEQVLTFDFDFQFPELYIHLMILATVCIAAAGYAINDYFDTDTDSINRPDKKVLGSILPQNAGMNLYIAFTLIGIALGSWTAYELGIWQVSFIYVLASGLLWYYSSVYKRSFLVGNLSIAVLTALVPFLVAIYEIPGLTSIYRPTLVNYNISFMYAVKWTLAFSAFAFLLTLIREIIKDAEDFEGDNAYGMNTMPIMAGITATKITVAVLVVGVISVLAWVNWSYFPNNMIVQYDFSNKGIFSNTLPDVITRWYFILGFLLPLLIVLYKTIRAQSAREYRIAGVFAKITMLSGILFCFVLLWMFNNYLIIFSTV